MAENKIQKKPNRITDLVKLKKAGLEVICDPAFEVLPVDFEHRHNPFRAYVFLCRFRGTVNGVAYMFRKCYARGCPHNLCPHVAQAVMTANRYLQRDFRRLRLSAIEVPDRLFSLDDMVVKFEDLQAEYGPTLTIHDYINIAREGNSVAIEIAVELVPAVEHFAHAKNKQTFLNADFAIETLGRVGHYQRCLSCYATENEMDEKPPAMEVANKRLSVLFQEFDDAGITYAKRFFE